MTFDNNNRFQTFNTQDKSSDLKRERHAVGHLDLKKFKKFALYVVAHEKQMDAGRGGKNIIIWERAGRESSHSRGQKTPRLNSDHESQSSGGVKIGLFLGTQVR